MRDFILLILILLSFCMTMYYKHRMKVFEKAFVTLAMSTYDPKNKDDIVKIVRIVKDEYNRPKNSN